FVDRSMHALEWKAADGERIGLLLHRQLLEPDTLEGDARIQAFDAFVIRETKDYTKRFPGLRWERQDDETPDAAMPVRRRAFRFKHDDSVLYQCQAFMLLGHKVVVMTAAAKAIHRDEV